MALQPVRSNAYSWGPGFAYEPTAAAVARELLQLGKRLNRPVTAQDFVAEARRQPGGALHQCLPWDADEVLAEQFRLIVAGSVIRHLRVSFVAEEARMVTLRAMVSVRLPGQRGYLPVTTVLSEPKLTAQMLTNAVNELRAFAAKYAHLLTATGASAIADQLVQALEAQLAAGP
jgi:hypothetical protein